MDVPVILKEKKKRKRKVQPTIKQIKALQFLNQGMSYRKSLIQAGYSVKQAAKGRTWFFGMPGARNALESMHQHLLNTGLNSEYMAQKIREFTDAKKIDHSHTEPDREVPDYRTQIEGVKLWRDILQETAPEGQKKKREMTITEFVTGEEDAPK